MFKGLGDLAGLLREAQKVREKMGALGDELRNQRVTGTAGGGMVEIEVSGTTEVLGCRIDPSLLEKKDQELLEDLITEAVNDAMNRAKQLHAEAMKNMTGGMNLPGMDDMLKQFMGGNR